MNRAIHSLILLGLFLFVGCIERSIVVKVRKDGSGVVHVRSYQRASSFSFAKAEPSKGDSSHKLPTEKSLQQIATKLGQGVRLESVASASNPQGWAGHEVVFVFDDVSNLHLQDELFSLDSLEEFAKLDQSTREQHMSLKTIRFAIKDETLHISRPMIVSRAASGNDQESRTDDPFAAAPKSLGISSVANPVFESMFANSLKDARLGLFVQIEDKIKETNATVHAGRQVTLLSLDVGQALKHKDEFEKLNGLAAIYQGEELEKRFKELSIVSKDITSN